MVALSFDHHTTLLTSSGYYKGLKANAIPSKTSGNILFMMCYNSHSNNPMHDKTSAIHNATCPKVLRNIKCKDWWIPKPHNKQNEQYHENELTFSFAILSYFSEAHKTEESKAAMSESEDM